MKAIRFMGDEYLSPDDVVSVSGYVLEDVDDYRRILVADPDTVLGMCEDYILTIFGEASRSDTVTLYTSMLRVALAVVDEEPHHGHLEAL